MKLVVDSNHSYKAGIEDVKYWSPKVKKRCLIIRDDYFIYEGVRKAVNDSFSNSNESGNTWFIEK
tara:strand:- start:1305 stop:1499 length:195 start_codon:yes stop_codon:yes gene_type:complete